MAEKLSGFFICGSLEFKSWSGQILHSITNGPPPFQHLCKLMCCLSDMLQR